MTVKELIQWHTARGIAAMKRAKEASTDECRDANAYAAIVHRETVEALCRLVEYEQI